MTRHLTAVDVARGLAALSVAVYHYGFGAGLVRVTGVPAWRWLGFPGSSLAVPVFFVLRGFCIHLGGRTEVGDLRGFTGRFLIRRFFRIYPAWLLAIGLSVLIRWLSGAPDVAPGLLSHLTLSNGFFADAQLNPVFWSVSVEFMLYLLYPAWLWLRRRNGLGLASLVPAVVSAASCLVCTAVFRQPTGPSLWFFGNVWVGWVAGAVLAEVWERPAASSRAIAGWSAFGGVAIIVHASLACAGLYSGRWAFIGLPISIVLCAWPVYWLLHAETRLAHRPLPVLAFVWRAAARIGVWSYSLYLLHVPLGAARLLVDARLQAGRSGRALLFGLWFLAILAAAGISYRWVERPAWNYGRSLAERLLRRPRRKDEERWVTPQPA